jgi:hypothetical protein
MPASFAARITRTAISPRFAMRTFLRACTDWCCTDWDTGDSLSDETG